MITKQQYYEACEKYYGSSYSITDEEFARCQEIRYEDDWVRPLTEDEYSERFHRVSGDVVCFICGKLYYDHPKENRLTGFDFHEHRLCNGWLGHL